MSETFITTSAYILSGILLLTGIAHFVYPKVYKPLFFKAIPNKIRFQLIYLSGVVEILLAIGLLIPAYRDLTAALVFLMFVAFLPLHVRDMFISRPVMGSKIGASLRLFLQFGLLYWVWLIGAESLI